MKKLTFLFVAILISTTTFNRGGQTSEMKSSEEWRLSNDGKLLTVKNTSPNFRGGGERTTIQVFEKE